MPTDHLTKPMESVKSPSHVDLEPPMESVKSPSHVDLEPPMLSAQKVDHHFYRLRESQPPSNG